MGGRAVTAIPPKLITNLRQIASTLTSPGQIDSLLYAADLLEERLTTEL